RPIRHDGLDKVTGRANYGADFELPGMLHGAILRSPHAHAKIVSIDTREARSLDGVKAVITGADMPRIPSKWMGGAEGGMDFGERADTCRAHDKALYHGHAVAAVAATSLDVARRACKLIKVQYEVLPAVLDVDAALAKNAPILPPDKKPMGHPPLP